ncbi:type 1 glutamine amidotransferase domain-containing protein [Sphingobacterium faecium]|uniref:type 1 glutamine amidotransferase domain-containing protein n=1 Tax=Sphingobacterium faecium TaxID=34087 RepID=UPI00320B5E75
MENKRNILMILSSHDRMDGTDSKTGVWLGEMTDPYYKFEEAGYQVLLASPLGGEPPLDPMSKLTEHLTSDNRKFLDDENAQQRFKNTVQLESVQSSAFDGVFIPGGHGPLWDLARHPEVSRLLADFIKEHKPIGAVCHGPAALVALAQTDPDFLVGRHVTAFTNMEENLVMRSDYIPFKLESRLKELGTSFSSAPVPFVPHVVRDGNLVTGQNPLSAGPTATKLIEVLQEISPKDI